MGDLVRTNTTRAEANMGQGFFSVLDLNLCLWSMVPGLLLSEPILVLVKNTDFWDAPRLIKLESFDVRPQNLHFIKILEGFLCIQKSDGHSQFQIIVPAMELSWAVMSQGGVLVCASGPFQEGPGEDQVSWGLKLKFYVGLF